MTFDSLSDLQKLCCKERVKSNKRFHKKYRTSLDKEEALKRMSNSDINYLIYCANTIPAKIFYSKFLKK